MKENEKALNDEKLLFCRNSETLMIAKQRWKNFHCLFFNFYLNGYVLLTLSEHFWFYR